MKNLDEREEELRELVTKIQNSRSESKKLKTLLETFEKEFGPKAEKRVLEIIAENAEKLWTSIAEERESNDIEGMIDSMWKPFEQAGGEFTMERTEDSAQFHCTKCPIADTYLKIGKPEYGLIFHCSADPHIVAGFNPRMEFRITKRIMNGEDCCNHYYHLK